MPGAMCRVCPVSAHCGVVVTAHMPVCRESEGVATLRALWDALCISRHAARLPRPLRSPPCQPLDISAPETSLLWEEGRQPECHLLRPESGGFREVITAMRTGWLLCAWTEEGLRLLLWGPR